MQCSDQPVARGPGMHREAEEALARSDLVAAVAYQQSVSRQRSTVTMSYGGEFVAANRRAGQSVAAVFERSEDGETMVWIATVPWAQADARLREAIDEQRAL